MTHKEFILVANQDIKEYTHNIETTYLKKGESIIVTEEVFEKLQKNETIERWTREGNVSMDKYMFENEVAFTQITIEYGTKKLGQRKNK
jgi:hypothetical protein